MKIYLAIYFSIDHFWFAKVLSCHTTAENAKQVLIDYANNEYGHTIDVDYWRDYSDDEWGGSEYGKAIFHQEYNWYAYSVYEYELDKNPFETSDDND